MLRRNAIILTLSAVVLAALMGAGCAKQGEAQRDGMTDTTRINAPADQTGSVPVTGSWVEERQAFETRINSEIKTLDTRIEQLSKESANASGEAKEHIDDQIEKFKSAREKLGENLRDLGQASQDDWASARDKINESLNNIDTTVVHDVPDAGE